MIGDEGWGDQLYLSLCKISTRGDQDPHRPGQVPPSSTQRQVLSTSGNDSSRQPPAQTATYLPAHLASFYRAPTVRWLHSRSEAQRGRGAPTGTTVPAPASWGFGLRVGSLGPAGVSRT